MAGTLDWTKDGISLRFLYSLTTQAWEECLQRRGLAERPGRLELQALYKSWEV